MADRIHEIVLEKIMAAMAEGIVPWSKPWSTFLPRNGKSNKKYRGINMLLLGMANHQDPRWFTFKQAQDLGGMVRKGEKSSLVVFWQMKEYDDPNSPDGKKVVPFLRYYNVFHSSQIDGMNLPPLTQRPCEINVEAETILANMPAMPKIVTGKAQASYSKATDTISMPLQSSFINDDEYYATLFHELAHATGAASRLNRASLVKNDGFGGETYSQEELVAELTSAFLCHRAGIVNVLHNQASYVKGWMSYLQHNPKCLINAASAAQKAYDYIMGETDAELGESQTVEEEVTAIA